MNATLVTGTPGSGKTALVAYAQSINDQRFFDADEILGLCEWRDFATGRVVGLVGEIAGDKSDAWYKQNGWYWNEKLLDDFLARNPGAIICGSSENVTECYRLFTNIFILRKTEQELLQNLLSPERLNPFGKTTQQRAGFIKWQNHLITEAGAYPAFIIDGNTIALAYRTILSRLIATEASSERSSI